MSLCFSYRRYFGTIIPHQKAAVFTARRAEMVEVMDQTLHFLNRQAMVRIYSPYSDVPRHVSIIMTIRLTSSECFCSSSLLCFALVSALCDLGRGLEV